MGDGIFISYRRKAGAMLASIIYSELCKHFKQERIFKDVKSLHAGDNFKKEIVAAIEGSDVFLVLINNGWASQTNRDLQGEDDFVYYELQCALEKKIEIIPVLFENASMPSPTDLPETINEVTLKHAFIVNSESVLEDIEKLVIHIKSKKKFKYEEKSLIGMTERLVKDPITLFKKGFTDGLDCYKKDFFYIKNFLRKNNDCCAFLLLAVRSVLFRFPSNSQ